MKKRLLYQILFFLLSIGILGFVVLAGKKSIHNICPYAIVCFGALKGNLLTLGLGIAALGGFLGILFMVVAMFWGRVFCGFICPLGSAQEFLYSLKRRRKKRTQIPYFAERKLSKLKYWVLGITMILVVTGFSWIYINFCPIYALSRLPALALGGLLTVVAIVISGMFLERFWCRFLCPYAALLNISQALGTLFGIKRIKVRRNLERCIDCGICSINCPMNLDILSEEFVSSSDCIHCMRCSEKCPKSGTICKGRES
jgi:polyferredoxin